MDDMGAKANMMNKMKTTILNPSYSPSNANLRMVKELPTCVSGVAHRISIMFGEKQGKNNFTIGL